MIFRLFQISIRNFRLHWRYLVSAGLSILFGMWGLLLFSLYAEDLGDLLDAVWQKRYMLGDIVIVDDKARPGIGGKIDLQEHTWIDNWIAAKTEKIAHRVKVLEGRGTIESGTVSTIFLAKGYEKLAAAELRGEKWKWDAVVGLPLHLGKSDQDLVAGQGLGRLLGCEFESFESELSANGFVPRERPFRCPSNNVTLKGMTASGRLNTVEGRLIGLVDGFFREIDSRLVVMTIEHAQKLFHTDSISYLVLKLKNPDAMPAVIDSLQHDMNQAGLGLKAMDWRKFREADIYRRAVTVTRLFELFILCVMGTISGLCVVYSFRKSTEERAREVGTLRSLGFYRRHIVTIFGFEAIILTIVCSVCAIGLTFISAQIINSQEIMYQVGGLNRPVQFTIGNAAGTYLSTVLWFLWLGPVTACLSALVVILRPIPLNLFNK